VHSYVTDEKIYCVYVASNEDIRNSAARNRKAVRTFGSTAGQSFAGCAPSILPHHPAPDQTKGAGKHRLAPLTAGGLNI
jgi:hypothetical protein